MSRADLSSHLRDPRVHARRLGEALVTGIGTTVIAPGRMAPWKRRGLHALSGVIGGGATACVVAQKDPRPSRTIPAAGAVSALLVGASVVGSALDTRAERWLDGRGVRHPRVLMGVGAGLFTLAMLWSEDLFEEEAEDVQQPEPDTPLV